MACVKGETTNQVWILTQGLLKFVFNIALVIDCHLFYVNFSSKVKEQEVRVAKEQEVKVVKEQEVKVVKEQEVKVVKEREVRVAKEQEARVDKEQEVKVVKEQEVRVVKAREVKEQNQPNQQTCVSNGWEKQFHTHLNLK